MTAPGAGAGSSGVRLWLAGARPRTLPAAVVPVLVGTAVAASGDAGAGKGIVLWRFLAAAVVALALQVATNYLNDYSDGVRGTDDESRVGPLRLVGSGAATPGAVRNAALLSLGVAACSGLLLAIAVGPELLVVGALSMLAGWLYTGGPWPYGYHALGEVFVFVFFGVVATVGSTYVQVEELSGWALLASVPVGLLIVALLVVNNLRDRPTDEAAGKRTLAVVLGDHRTRLLYVGCLSSMLLTLAFAGWRPWSLLAMAAVPAAIPAGRAVLGGAAGPALIPVLGSTGRLVLIYGVLLAVGLWISA